MGVLNVHHPDILEFIDAKKENTSGQGPLHNFNISVAVTEEFIQAYKEDTTFKLVAPHTGEVVGELNAREVMHKIAENAWRTGDPGIIFDAVVTSLISRDEYYSRQSVRFVEDTFGGSLPKFLTAFISGKKISRQQVEELKRLIDEYKED